MLQNVPWDNANSVQAVCGWVEQFKARKTEVQDAQRSGQPSEVPAYHLLRSHWNYWDNPAPIGICVTADYHRTVIEKKK